jgi:benzylsuccinate CoA-transferase BbsF subunit
MDINLPLKDLKVLELTRVIVGPGVARFLGSAGATVVHVESQKRVDFMRISYPYKDNKPGINRAAYFNRYNPDKLGMSLDLSKPQGLALMKRLVTWADVFIESNVPGMIDKFGLDYENVRKLNPGIIMLSTNQMGREGPLAHYKGFGVQTAAIAGYHQITGYGDGSPMGPFGAYTDMVSIQWLLTALLAALDYRKRTGKGQYIDHSQLEAGVHFLAPAILQYTANGTEMPQAGNKELYAAPHGCYRCKGNDRWCAVTVYTDEEWQSFCCILGNPLWTKDTAFATVIGRKENEKRLDMLVTEWTLQFSPEEIAEKMQKAGIAAGVVASGEDLSKNPQLKARGFYPMLNHTETGPVMFNNPPFKLSESSVEVREAAPCLGEHNEYVCREILGLSDDEFIDILKSGALE